MLLTENIDVNTVAEVVQVDPNALDKFMKELPDHLLIFGVRVILCLLVFWVGGRIISLLRKIVREEDRTLIMVTHDEKDAEGADKILSF